MKRYVLLLIVSAILFSGLFALGTLAGAQSATYEVGPGKPYAAIGDVPWESLQPGDTVLIHYRSTPYKEKFVICRQGTAAAPITVRGVPGPNGELPIIDGNGATTRAALSYWNQERSVIKIGGASNPPDTLPKYITIENLDIRSARPPYTFTATDGSTKSYISSASSIYVEKGENITVRNCTLRDSANGFFVASSDAVASRNILVEGNYIYDNGVENSIFQHNNYTAAIGIIFQYNRFGPLRAGCPGNNLKDRSAGLVVRYNWIEGGNRQLDLVDGEDSGLIRNDPRYRETHVYGNILIEPDAAGNRQIAHYGGDSGNTPAYRKGTLYFYHNTVVSTRTDRTTLLRLSTNEETCDFRNNIVYVTAAGNTVSLVDSAGVLNLSHNWFKPGYVSTFGTLTGTINDNGTSVLGSSPGFVDAAGQDYRLAAGSACIDAGAFLHPNILPANYVISQYVKHQGGEGRPSNGALDIGAYENQSAPPADLTITTTSLPGGTVGVSYSATLAATGGVAPYTWSVISGSLPAGLSLNSSTGVISGTPTSAGTANFTAQATDAQNPADTDSRALAITINPPPPASLNITTTSLPNGRRGTAYSQTLQATGGVTPYVWSIASGSLPPGLSLNSATGTISGTPTKRGTWSFTARVRDSQATPATDTQALSIKISR
ncbi:MAG TPA: Ig domain-containing protein [Blastocatellia bacterium]|nr:Ig domain-containing protein [Blastocatellia bacterium]